MRRIVLPLIVLSVACGSGVHIWIGGTHLTSEPRMTISNPAPGSGDRAAGRVTFIDVKCIDCHRVAEDPHLPMGRRAIAGPMLRDLKRYSPKELAARITDRKTGADQPLFDRTMKDYTDLLTAQQLVDIIAYLRDPKPPAS